MPLREARQEIRLQDGNNPREQLIDFSSINNVVPSCNNGMRWHYGSLQSDLLVHPFLVTPCFAVEYQGSGGSRGTQT
jgi:hypothetical protein